MNLCTFFYSRILNFFYLSGGGGSSLSLDDKEMKIWEIFFSLIEKFISSVLAVATGVIFPKLETNP